MLEIATSEGHMAPFGKVVLMLALALALPLAAHGDEPATVQPEVTPGASSPQTANVVDSPLVAAAKRSGRKGRKPANVITNETLKQRGAHAHMTTTREQRPITLPAEAPRPTPEMAAARAAESHRKQVAAQKRTAARERAAAAAEDGVFDDAEADADAARAEKTLHETSQQKPPRG